MTKLTYNPPLSVFSSKPAPIILPILIAFGVYYGSAVLHQVLPNIPFLLPTAVLLIVMTSNSLPLFIRGTTKTILALFFTFTAFQCMTHFQLNVFGGLHHAFDHPASSQHIELPQITEFSLPQFLVISSTSSTCAEPSSIIEDRYQLHDNIVNSVQMQTHLTHHESHCIELIPLFEIGGLTVGLSPYNTKITSHPAAEKGADSGATADDIAEKPHRHEDHYARLSNPLLFQRVLHLLSTRSIIPLPSMISQLLTETALNLPINASLPINSSASAHKHSDGHITVEPSHSTESFFSVFMHSTKYQKMIFVGLIFSAIGDVCLIFGHVESFFLSGLVSFLLGHVVYLIAYVVCLSQSPHVSSLPAQIFLTSLQYIGLIIIVFRWVLAAGKCKGMMKGAVLSYCIVIGMMACAATLLAFATPATTTLSDIQQQQRLDAFITSHTHLFPGNSTHVLSSATIDPSLYPLTDDDKLLLLEETKTLIRYKPLIYESLSHINDVLVLLPMHLSQLLTRTLGLSTSDPLTIAEYHFKSHSSVHDESWQAFFAFIGATFFFVSDIFVAREKFVESSPLNPLFGLPIYFIGQLFIATALKYR